MKFPAALSAALVLEFWRPGNARGEGWALSWGRFSLRGRDRAAKPFDSEELSS